MRRKNKEEEERKARQERREQSKAKRRAEPNLERSEAELPTNPSILIVCEGKNTEPSYFKQFRLASATVTSVGEGYNTTSLVKRAETLANQKKYDQVWCVFDKDDFRDEEFNEAIKLAESKDFGVAFSNQSFEYWLILHFEDHQGGGMHRRGYHTKINNLLKPFNVTYDGNDSKNISDNFFDILDGTDLTTSRKRVQLAIDRAKRNLAFFDGTNPAKQESSTTVFRLVEELLKYL